MTKDGRDILNGTYLILVREWVRTGRLEVNSLQNLLEDKKNRISFDCSFSVFIHWERHLESGHNKVQQKGAGSEKAFL